MAKLFVVRISYMALVSAESKDLAYEAANDEKRDIVNDTIRADIDVIREIGSEEAGEKLGYNLDEQVYGAEEITDQIT